MTFFLKLYFDTSLLGGATFGEGQMVTLAIL